MISRIRTLGRTLGYRSYFRLVALNYRYRLAPRTNRTPAGTIRCYELVNRHGDDDMLGMMGRECGDDDVIYDIGANVGVYALALARGHPGRQVVAFEPAPRTAGHLSRNVSLNGLSSTVDIREVGLGEERTEARFFVSTYPELSGFDRQSATRWGATVAKTVRVPVETLDAVAEKGPPPDVLKLDVEGATPRVLAGARETLVESEPTLYIETHDEGFESDPVAETEQLLDELGYRSQKHDGYWRCVRV